MPRKRTRVRQTTPPAQVAKPTIDIGAALKLPPAAPTDLIAHNAASFAMLHALADPSPARDAEPASAELAEKWQTAPREIAGAAADAAGQAAGSAPHDAHAEPGLGDMPPGDWALDVSQAYIQRHGAMGLTYLMIEQAEGLQLQLEEMTNVIQDLIALLQTR